MRFWKYQALGNDFILAPGPTIGGRISSKTPRRLIARLCDRHFGVGADGILVLELSTLGDARMIVLNADGSRPEMCGNGIRCFVAHLAREAGLTSGTFSVETDAGLMTCRLAPGPRRGHVEVSVAMGPAKLGASFAHVDPKLRAAPGEPIHLPDIPWALYPASMGNPHAVIRVDDPDVDLNALAHTEGPRLSNHPAFLDRVNVEWTRVAEPGVLDVVVHERGVGVTLACGTGACAAVAVAHRQGWTSNACTEGVTVRLPGGDLVIKLEDDGRDPNTVASVLMTGPAALAFEGRLDPVMLKEEGIE